MPLNDIARRVRPGGCRVVLNDVQSSSTVLLMEFYGSYRDSASGRSADFGPSCSLLGFSPVDTLRLAWVRLLGRYPWDCFATLTWAKAPGDEQVRRDFRTWLFTWMGNVAVQRGLARWVASRDGQRLRGWWVNQRRKGRHEVVFALGVEPQRSGRLHVHSLLRFPPCFGEVYRGDGWESWKDRHGFARLEPPKSQDDVAGYVSKYVVKPEADLVVSESFQAVL